MTELTIETLVGNALIELIERKGVNQISYSTVHQFGTAVVTDLERKGIRTIISSNRDSIKEFESSTSSIFDFYEHNKEKYISFSKGTTEQLRSIFRSFLTIETLIAMTSGEALKVLGINKNSGVLIDNLKEKLLRDRTLDDIVLALFYSTKQEAITKNPVLLHRAFEEIKNETKMSLLNKLLFNNNGVHPWSDELDESFTRLEMSDLLPYIISGRESWYFLDWSREHQGKSYMKFNEDEKSQIVEGAQILKKLPQPIKK